MTLHNRPKLFADILDLISGGRKPEYAFERAIRFYQFRVWMVSPSRDYWRTAGFLFVAKLFETEAARDATSKKERGRKLSRLMKDKDYKKLYQKFMQPRGGWTTLVRNASLGRFDERVRKDFDAITTATRMTSYRYRSAVHDCLGPLNAGIDHSKFYVIARYDSDRVLKTINNQWHRTAASSALLYAYKANRARPQPRKLLNGAVVKRTIAEADNTDEIRALLGNALHIQQTLGGLKGNDLRLPFPSCVDAVPLTVPSFSEQEQALMRKYDARMPKLRAGEKFSAMASDGNQARPT